MLYHLPRWYGAGRTSIFAEIFLSEQSENTVRGPLLAALQVIREHKCDCVADTRNGFADNPEDTKWVADYFMPTASEYGCRTIFFIIDKANSLKDELERQANESADIINFRCSGFSKRTSGLSNCFKGGKYNDFYLVPEMFNLPESEKMVG